MHNETEDKSPAQGAEPQAGNPSPQVSLRLEELRRGIEPQEGDAATAQGPGAPVPEKVDYAAMLNGLVDMAREGTAWTYPEKPVALFVNGTAQILERMPVDKAAEMLDRLGPYVMAAGGLFMICKANTVTVEIDGQRKTRLRPLFKSEEPAEPEGGKA